MRFSKSWLISLVVCIFTITCVNYFAFHGQAAVAASLTSRFEQSMAYLSNDSEAEIRHLTPEEIVRQGLSLALTDGEIATAFEYWISLMPPQMAEALYESNMISTVVTAAESLGKLNSYELLGTVRLENLNTQLKAQLVYSKLAGKGWSSYSRFILLETLDGWQIIDVEMRGQRSQIIDNFTSLILESEDAQRLIERALSYTS